MHPSDKRPRTYASGANKRRDKKQKLENAVTNTPKMENYFGVNKTSVVPQSDEEQELGLECDASVSVLLNLRDRALASAAGEMLASDNEPTAEASTSSSAEPIDTTYSDHELVYLDLSAEYPTDCAHFPSRMSDVLRDHVVSFGPCRPKGPYPVNDEFGRRSFSEKHYQVTSGGITIERSWLCFSPQLNKPYCQSCWIFGDQSAPQKEWTDGVPGNPKHYGDKIKSHEKNGGASYRMLCFGTVESRAANRQ